MAEYLSRFTGARVDSSVGKIPDALPTEDNSIIVINQDGTTGYTALSSLGAGDVVASGNNAFTGNNTFAGSSTFNGDVTMAKTPTIPGYAKLADANTFTAPNVFQTTTSFGVDNGLEIGTKAGNAPWLGMKMKATSTQDVSHIKFVYHEGGSAGGEKYAYFPDQNGVIALTPTTAPTEDSLLVYNASRASSWKKLSELGVGDVTAAGNNVFTGTNTFSLNTYFPNSISLYSSGSTPQVNELYEISKSGLRVMGGDTSGILVKFSDLTNVASTDTTRTIPFLEQANEFTAANNFIYKNTTAALQTTIKLDAEDGGITVGSGGIGAIAQYVKISSTGISMKSSGASAATYNYSLPDASGTLALTTDIDGCAKLASENTFTANNIFTSALFSGGVDFDGNNNRFRNGFATNSFTNWDGTKTFTVPSKTGILALTDDIASAVAGLAERNSSNEFTANNYFAYNKGIDIGEKSVAPPWLAIRNDETAAAGKIAFLYHDGNAENTQNVAYFPAQSGVIALTPTTAPTENSFVVYDTNFKPKWIKGNSVADSATVSGLEARLTKIETLLAPGLAETNPRALYWLLTE